eukprot:GFUD01016038.1.p1 GENE.GFUD01016038.1~~GFUD01016038.1.p1  ORF type:complete len:326 (+),score=83.05 GFUD01016038.1:39-1016(+)
MSDDQICLVVLIGIPGSGKSSFCELYSDYLSAKKCSCIHVCYDKLIPLERQAEMRGEQGCWKAEREKIVEAVEQVLKIRSGRKEVEDLNNVYADKIVGETTSGRTVILIDDNNYLPSMRYDYYQLARAYKLGFAQLHFSCDLPLAKRLNSSRAASCRVPDEVLENMSSKLEPPNPFSNKWEAFSFSLPVLESVPHNLELVESIVEAATVNPVIPVETVSEEVKEKDRVACSASLVHQADKYLRGMVNKKMGEMKSQGLNKEGMKEASHTIYNVKGEVLEDLKTGFTMLDKELVDAVTNREKGSGEKLATEIEELFKKKLIVSESK